MPEDSDTLDQAIGTEESDVETPTTEEEETQSPDDEETDETVEDQETEETPEEEEPAPVPYSRFKEVNEQLKAVAEVIYNNPETKEAFLKAVRKNQGLEVEDTSPVKEKQAEEYEDFESDGERFLYKQNRNLINQVAELSKEVRTLKDETQSDRAERVKQAFETALKLAEKDLGFVIPEESKEGIAAVASSRFGTDPIPDAVKKAAKMVFAPVIKATKEKMDTVDRKKEGIVRTGGGGNHKATKPVEDYDDLDQAIRASLKSVKK